MLIFNNWRFFIQLATSWNVQFSYGLTNETIEIVSNEFSAKLLLQLSTNCFSSL